MKLVAIFFLVGLPAMLLLGGCGTVAPATIEAECVLFPDPGFAVQGQRLQDKRWIGRVQETGITVCNWQRPTK